MWKPFIVPGNIFSQDSHWRLWSRAEVDGYWPHNRLNSRVGPFPYHKCCRALRCALIVFICFYTVVYGVVVFVFVDICGLFCKQTSAASRLKPHVCRWYIPGNMRYLLKVGPSTFIFRWRFSSCPCFPGSFSLCHSCIWPCRTDSPLASEKCCFWNSVFSTQGG